MVSLRFPFSFPNPPKPTPPKDNHSNFSARTFSVAAAACSAAGVVAAGVALSQNPNTNPLLQNAFNFFTSFNQNRFGPMWGSLSLTDSPASSVTESRTGMSFPSFLQDSQRLLGIGLRKKAVLGLKNIDVYAFGVYANDDELKSFINDKYGKISMPELKEKELKEDLLESDVCMTVRLQIVYSRLSIKSVRNAFEESVGSRLKKFGGADNKDLLQRFASQFKDEYKIPRGSIIELSRRRGYVLHTSIDGKEVGSIQSKLLCRSLFDLYIGNESFDSKAQEDVERSLASLLL